MFNLAKLENSFGDIKNWFHCQISLELLHCVFLEDIVDNDTMISAVKKKLFNFLQLSVFQETLNAILLYLIA